MTEYFNENILSVTELNGYVKEVLDAIPVFRNLRVRGEISNYKHYTQNGHRYFSLKDGSAVIKAVMFASYGKELTFLPENGMKVVVRGSLSAYPRDGVYQIYVTGMEPDGKGALYEAYEKLKKKLMDEIVTLMDRNDAAANAKIEENKRLINECNDKIKEYQEELLDIPKQIEEVNAELMIETMKICYENMRLNEHHINSISKWIADVRVELKKNVVRKQEMEIANQEIYSFMHDIFGADVIDIFDMKYNPEEHPVVKQGNRKKKASETESE